ncbi:flagellar motor switch protein FliM [Aquipuribacter sp. MA13-6]|uniref:flagellar motor switch protein FliM n=1 Tax=unclassified Aquipuribacter TaxID=2635084 RepID=UPI003EEDB754
MRTDTGSTTSARRRGDRARATPSNPEPYDFRRPTKLSREHARGLQVVAETFARQWATQFSTMLRDGQVEPGAVTQTTYGKYVAALPAPSLLAVISSPELKDFVLHVEHDLAMAAVDRLLGGRGDAEQPARPATQLETALLRGLLERVVAELPYAFAPLGAVTPKLQQLETNPQFAQVVGPAEALVVMDFSVTVGDVTGSATLAVPYSSMQPLLNPEGTDVRTVSRTNPAAEQGLSDVPMEVGARMRGVRMTSDDVLALAVGDVVRLGHQADSPLLLVAGERAFARAVPANRRNRLACLIVDPRKDRS